MSNYKSQLKRIVEGLKHTDPAIRHDAIFELIELSEVDDLQFNLLTLEWLAKEAAYPYPTSFKVWDEPSYHLIKFISDFEIPELTEALIKYYPEYSKAAKEEVFRYITSFDGEEHELAILELIEQDIQNKQVVLPLDVLYDNPGIIIKLLEKHTELFEVEEYKTTFYRLLSYCLDKNYLDRFKTKYIAPLLLVDYQKQVDEFLRYQNDYDIKFVYGSWKETYLQIRSIMAIYLSLMEYYFNDEMTPFIKEAMSFTDPFIRTNAIIAALQRDIDVPEELLLDCATNIESTEYFYWEILRIRKEHLFPINEKKQEYFAKSHLFLHIVQEHDFVPETIELVKQLDIENSYNQPIRYYLASVSHDDQVIPAWVGAYSLEEEDDSIHMWEGTYLEDGQFNEKSIEEHVQLFMDKRANEKEEDASLVHYEGKPKISKWFYAWYLLLALRGYQAFSTMDPVYISLTTLLAALIVSYHIYKTTLVKKKIEIVGNVVRYTEKDAHSQILLEDIKKITIQKSNMKTRLLDRRSQVVAIYNKQNKVALEFPLECVSYDEFAFVVDELTDHLKEQPHIQQQ
ncbi:hypothetical protein V7148_03130 [Gottfriedia acidiceleris]|uniref:hypothetical protein n=1 Tax=Gottfriedia acidiceleris TaxID=371036 RepID=UPI002FFED7C9